MSSTISTICFILLLVPFITSQVPYKITSFNAVMSISDDCYVNMAEQFSITNQVSGSSSALSVFTRYIPRSVATEIVPRSIKVTSPIKKIFNTTLVDSGEYFAIVVELTSPLTSGETGYFTLNYQLAGPLVVGDSIDRVQFNFSGPIEIVKLNFAIQFTDQVKHLHGYRQFSITPMNNVIITDNSVSWEVAYKFAPIVEFPALRSFDICRPQRVSDLISISVVNLVGIISLLILQLIVIGFLVFSRCKSERKGFVEVGSSGGGYGSSHNSKY